MRTCNENENTEPLKRRSNGQLRILLRQSPLPRRRQVFHLFSLLAAAKWCWWISHICRSFTHSELDDLRSLYTSLAAKSGSNGKHVSPDAFKVLFLLYLETGFWFLRIVLQVIRSLQFCVTSFSLFMYM